MTTIEKLRKFETWLASKNPSTTYNWGDIDNCLVFKFLRETGGDSDDYMGLACPHRNHNIAFPNPHTYGAALDRLKKAMWDLTCEEVE